jgi:hypothetical protein
MNRAKVKNMNELYGLILFSLFITSTVALFFFLIRTSKYVKHALIALSGVIMIAHGSRMISQGIFFLEVCINQVFLISYLIGSPCCFLVVLLRGMALLDFIRMLDPNPKTNKPKKPSIPNIEHNTEY